MLSEICVIAAFLTPIQAYVQHNNGAVSAQFINEDEQYQKLTVPKPAYNFAYGIKSYETGDVKSQKEESDGNVVKGEYHVNDPDGFVRSVKYIVESGKGFQAHVTRTKGNHAFEIIPRVIYNPAAAKKANLESKRPLKRDEGSESDETGSYQGREPFTRIKFPSSTNHVTVRTPVKSIPIVVVDDNGEHTNEDYADSGEIETNGGFVPYMNLEQYSQEFEPYVEAQRLYNGQQQDANAKRYYKRQDSGDVEVVGAKTSKTQES